MKLKSLLTIIEATNILQDGLIDVDLDIAIRDMTVQELADISIHIGEPRDDPRGALIQLYERIEKPSC